MRAWGGAWRWQRMSAMALAICVTVHLVTMIIVVHGGLSAAAIVERLNGNFAWGAFYSFFVLAAAIHAPIGLRRIAEEWLGWRGRSVIAASAAVGVALALAGWRAVFALVGGGV